MNLGDSLEDFVAFGRQNTEFFPILILDETTVSGMPLSQPCVQGTRFTAEGDMPIWTRVITWDAACHRLALFYRDTLRRAAWPTTPQRDSWGTDFMLLLAIEPPATFADWHDAFKVVRDRYLAASAEAPGFSRLRADWETGTFEYQPENDFQRAVYVLFREGWRAKICPQCLRRFIASRPVQSYCSTRCSGKAKRERNLAWWNTHGKKLRKRREIASRLKVRKSTKKGGK